MSQLIGNILLAVAECVFVVCLVLAFWRRS